MKLFSGLRLCKGLSQHVHEVGSSTLPNAVDLSNLSVKASVEPDSRSHVDDRCVLAIASTSAWGPDQAAASANWFDSYSYLLQQN